MPTHPSFARAWFRQHEEGARAVAAVERRELRELDPGQALRDSDALLSATPIASVAKSRRATSGIVEQQRLFVRARRSGRHRVGCASVRGMFTLA
jgi:hypothetical protein